MGHVVLHQTNACTQEVRHPRHAVLRLKYLKHLKFNTLCHRADICLDQDMLHRT